MRQWFPFISLESYREVIAAKDETIALQRETIANLTKSLESFQEAMAAVRTAASVPRPPRQREPQEKSKPIDYANLDPNDQTMLLEAASRELGGSRVSGQALITKAEQIKRLIIDSRRARTGDHGAPVPTTNPDVPEAIQSQIEQAEREGIAAAGRVN